MKHMGSLLVLGMAGIILGWGGWSTTAAAKAKEPQFVYIDSQTNMQTSAGTSQVVTRQAVTALTQPTDRTAPVSVTIPKNTALTLVRRTGGDAVVVTPGSTQTLVVANIGQVTYSNRAIKLTKAHYRELVKRSKAWAGKLSKRQVKVIGTYTGEGSDKINNALRYPQRKTTAKTRQRVKDLAASLKTFKLTHPMTVYRGTSKKVARIALHQAKLKPGAVYSDPGFASTSTSHAVATEFTSQLLLKINFPKGYHGAYLAPISNYPDEKEYLLNPNTKLVVTKVQTVISHNTTKLMEQTGKKVSTHQSRESSTYQLVTLNLMQ
ncbi:ADP-ribosylating toxin [Lactobacillus sp. ZJLC28-8]|nr:ADP-ribosylating toxin [Lactobacillus sp. HBUAS51381]